MEEELSLPKNNQRGADREKRRKMFLILFRLIYIFVIFAIALGLVALFWKISNVMYDKKGAPHRSNPTQGTLDVYAKKEKTSPLSTFDTGPLHFEMKEKDPLSSGIVVKIQVILAYDPSSPEKEIGTSSSLAVELERRKSQIQDIVRDLLIRKSYEELLDHNNLVRIKKELQNRINRVLVNGRIADIYLAQWDIIPR